jgi:hypothetical protein
MANTQQSNPPHDTTDVNLDADVNTPPPTPTNETVQDTTTTTTTTTTSQSGPESGCTHPLHPSHPPSAPQICPYNNLYLLADAVACVGSYILERGGARTWRETIETRHRVSKNELWQWVCIVRGAGKAKKRSGTAEAAAVAAQQEKGEVGYRVRKARFLCAVLETEQLARAEKEWDNRHFACPRSHSATSALDLLRKMEERGGLDALERDAAAFAVRRGAEWVVVAQEGFPDDEEEEVGEDEPGRVLWFMVSEAQRDYLDSWMVLPEEGDAAAVPASKEKTMRSAKTISFAEQVRVCGLADIDDIAQTASPNAGILLAKASEEVRPLNEGPARRQSRWRRNPKTTKYRVPGAWAVAEGSEPVDTSGLRKDPAQWAEYQQSLDVADA